MKTMKYFLSMAALALVGTIMTGCSSEDDLAGNQQSAKQDNIVTVTTTIGLGDGTRALSAGGVKTFEVGDQIALFYEQDGSLEQFKAVATAQDISDDGKSATFTFELTNPKSNSDITLSYPAAFTDNPSGVISPALTQDGTLNGGVKANDFSFAMSNLVGTDLPASITLENRFAVVAFTLKDGKGTADKADDVDVTSTITGMTIELTIYEKTYTITRDAAPGPIYVVLPPISEGETINITATGGGKTYTKSYTKVYALSNFYQQGLLMTEAAPAATDLSTISEAYTASDGEILTGTLASNVKISIADGATVTLNNVTINGTNDSNYAWAGITCLGDATIILSGTNTVTGFYNEYPGIYVPEGNTVTIKGSGSLTASSNGYAAGIGAGYALSCGDIEIQGGDITATGGYPSAGIGSGNGSACGTITISGGTVTATGGNSGAGIGSGNAHATCGAITISGGTVEATGGQYGAGIGSGFESACGTINIASTVIKVTATKGTDAPYSIGKGGGSSSSCGTVTIGGNVGAITDSPYTYQP